MRNKNLKISRAAMVVSLLLLGFLFSSCTREQLPDEKIYGKDYADITMELIPPGDYTAAITRAMTDKQQNTIRTATVLVYDLSGSLLYHKACNLTDNKLIVQLKTSKSVTDLFDVVVIANASAGFQFDNYKTKNELQAALIGTVTGKWTGVEFMMWGEKRSTLIEPYSSNLKIDMIRCMARIDVGAGTYDKVKDTWSGLTNFSLVEVRVINTRNKFAVIPLQSTLSKTGKTKVTAPTIPDGTIIQGKTADDAIKYSGADIKNVNSRGAYINSTIFVAEASNAPDNERITLIVGGSYNGEAVSYYRIDLCVPQTEGTEYDYLNILRNHRYNITINKVAGRGFASAQDALVSSIPINKNIFVTLVPVSENEENSGDILVNRDSYIKSDVSEVQILSVPDGVKTYGIATIQAANMSLPSITGSVTGPGISGSISLDNGKSKSIEVAIPAMASGETQKEYNYVVEFGTLKKNIKVTIKAPLDGFASVLPYTDVEWMKIENGTIGITLSHNEIYNKDEQQIDYINGNADSKAYIHVPVNLAANGTPRIFKVLISNKTNQLTTRVILEQNELGGVVVGHFGGDDPLTGDNVGIGGRMYSKQIAIAPSDAPTQLQFHPKGMSMRISDYPSFTGRYYGRNMNVWVETTTYIGAPKDEYLAISYCTKMNKDTNNNGVIDDSEMVWYLPGIHQLQAIYIFNEGLDNRLEWGYYWSIFESEDLYNSQKQHYFDFYLGTCLKTTKDKSHRVRCIRDVSTSL